MSDELRALKEQRAWHAAQGDSAQVAVLDERIRVARSQLAADELQRNHDRIRVLEDRRGAIDAELAGLRDVLYARTGS